MRAHGTLTEWNDGRGFGFIASAQGGEKVFVHISAFPADGQRPRLGELISFETEQDAKGKRRATRVMRPGAQSRARQSRGSKRPGRSTWAVSAVFSLIAIGAIAAYAYGRMESAGQLEAVTPTPTSAQTAATPGFHCDGRTMCSQMTSCAEAKNFLRHCPNTTMDGNHDGMPCEQQWCH
jgi:cold shock CspA family protein